MKQVTQKSYGEAVDTVVEQYKKAKKIDPTELLALAGELKGHWDSIAGEVTAVSKKVVPTVKKLVKKTAPKKTSKPTPKKAAKKRL
jgi:NH3-dependent NAD+ synthetase